MSNSLINLRLGINLSSIIQSYVVNDKEFCNKSDPFLGESVKYWGS